MMRSKALISCFWLKPVELIRWRRVLLDPGGDRREPPEADLLDDDDIFILGILGTKSHGDY